MGILIADSSELIIERITELIAEFSDKKNFYRATSYDEAKTIFQNKKPDIILLDAGLPASGSCDLIKVIRDSGIKASVIVLSVHIDDNTRKKYKACGADFFFDKFNDFDKIPKVISDIRSVA